MQLFCQLRPLNSAHGLGSSELLIMQVPRTDLQLLVLAVAGAERQHGRPCFALADTDCSVRLSKQSVMHMQHHVQQSIARTMIPPEAKAISLGSTFYPPRATW